jgi:hypothetical protein
LVPILSQLNPVHTLQSCLFKMHFYILPCTSCLLPLFLPKLCVHSSSHPNMLDTLSIFSERLVRCNTLGVTEQFVVTVRLYNSIWEVLLWAGLSATLIDMFHQSVQINVGIKLKLSLCLTN